MTNTYIVRAKFDGMQQEYHYQRHDLVGAERTYAAIRATFKRTNITGVVQLIDLDGGLLAECRTGPKHRALGETDKFPTKARCVGRKNHSSCPLHNPTYYAKRVAKHKAS